MSQEIVLECRFSMCFMYAQHFGKGFCLITGAEKHPNSGRKRLYVLQKSAKYDLLHLRLSKYRSVNWNPVSVQF